MANDLNQCNFTGRLGADPEVRYTQSGTAVASMRIAVGGSKKVNDAWEDTTEWVPIVLWNRMAETAGKFLTKGSQVRITGRFQTRKWQDQQGNDRYTTEIIASDMQMLGGKPSGNGDQSQSAPPPQQQQKPQGGGQSSGAQRPALDNDFDDDIPFVRDSGDVDNVIFSAVGILKGLPGV